jgi:hypothetical protein
MLPAFCQTTSATSLPSATLPKWVPATALCWAAQAQQYRQRRHWHGDAWFLLAFECHRGWLANADACLKKNIQPLNSQLMLQKRLALQGVINEWNDHQTGSKRPEGIR